MTETHVCFCGPCSTRITELESAIAAYRKRLADACDKHVLREIAIDRNGGSSEEIAEARASADSYSDALAWAAAIPTEPNIEEKGEL